MANTLTSGIGTKVFKQGPLIPYLMFANNGKMFVNQDVCKTNRYAAR